MLYKFYVVICWILGSTLRVAQSQQLFILFLYLCVQAFIVCVIDCDCLCVIYVCRN